MERAALHAESLLVYAVLHMLACLCLAGTCVVVGVQPSRGRVQQFCSRMVAASSWMTAAANQNMWWRVLVHVIHFVCWWLHMA